MLIQTFVLKVINNERKILTHHEIIDCIAEQIVVLSTIWYHSYNLKNVKNTRGVVLILVTKSNTPPSVFFTFFKLRTWY